LKLMVMCHMSAVMRSCPSWARGLKSKITIASAVDNVVPLVGTWIEISCKMACVHV